MDTACQVLPARLGVGVRLVTILPPCTVLPPPLVGTTVPPLITLNETPEVVDRLVLVVDWLPKLNTEAW